MSTGLFHKFQYNGITASQYKCKGEGGGRGEPNKDVRIGITYSFLLLLVCFVFDCSVVELSSPFTEYMVYSIEHR